jgi:hypothetical protein
MTKQIDQTKEAGDIIQMFIEEAYWKQQMKTAKQKNVAAAQLLTTMKNKEVQAKRNEGVLATYAFMVPLPALERDLTEEEVRYKEG